MLIRQVLVVLIMCITACQVTQAQQITFADTASLFMPGMVSTKNAEVKITFSPDGKKMLWGGIDWIPGKTDMDIWQSTHINGQWGAPERVSFNSDANDFDPYFLPNGSGVYFFSNRSGGIGGDDIYFVPYNSSTLTFGNPVNIGDGINTTGNEWAPVTNPAGTKLIFSSNGHGGLGGQDLFMADILPGGFGKPVNLGGAINTAGDEFDAIMLPENALVFTSAKDTNAKADLYIAYFTTRPAANGSPRVVNGTSPRLKLPAQINGMEYWSLGPSINHSQPGYLYFSAHLPDGVGRTDIYRIKYSTTGPAR